VFGSFVTIQMLQGQILLKTRKNIKMEKKSDATKQENIVEEGKMEEE
jgi:hypothetical protein